MARPSLAGGGRACRAYTCLREPVPARTSSPCRPQPESGPVRSGGDRRASGSSPSRIPPGIPQRPCPENRLQVVGHGRRGGPVGAAGRRGADRLGGAARDPHRTLVRRRWGARSRTARGGRSGSPSGFRSAPPSGRSCSARSSPRLRSRSREIGQSEIRCVSTAASRISFRVVLQRLDPRDDVRRAVPRLVPDAELLAGHHRGDLRPQPLAGVGLGAEAAVLDQGRAVRPARVTRRGPQLVQAVWV